VASRESKTSSEEDSERIDEEETSDEDDEEEEQDSEELFNLLLFEFGWSLKAVRFLPLEEKLEVRSSDASRACSRSSSSETSVG
jgi:hypothetical protein